MTFKLLALTSILTALLFAAPASQKGQPKWDVYLVEGGSMKGDTTAPLGFALPTGTITGWLFPAETSLNDVATSSSSGRNKTTILHFWFALSVTASQKYLFNLTPVNDGALTNAAPNTKCAFPGSSITLGDPSRNADCLYGFLNGQSHPAPGYTRTGARFTLVDRNVDYSAMQLGKSYNADFFLYDYLESSYPPACSTAGFAFDASFPSNASNKTTVTRLAGNVWKIEAGAQIGVATPVPEVDPLSPNYTYPDKFFAACSLDNIANRLHVWSLPQEVRFTMYFVRR